MQFFGYQLYLNKVVKNISPYTFKLLFQYILHKPPFQLDVSTVYERQKNEASWRQDRRISLQTWNSQSFLQKDTKITVKKDVDKYTDPKLGVIKRKHHEVTRQYTKWEKIFNIHKTHRRLVSWKYKELLQTNITKRWWKKWDKTWIVIHKRTYTNSW